MKMRHMLWLGVGFIVLIAVVMLIPGTPLYLPDFFTSRGQHEGHSTQYWMDALDSSDPKTRHKAISALGAIGAKAGEAVVALATILVNDSDAEARHQAALALSKMNPASAKVVPELAKALKDKEPFVRVNVVIALRRLGKDARPAVPALIQALQDKANQTNLKRFTFTIQEMAALALGQASAGTAEAVPALTEFLKSADTPGTRAAAARALGAVGTEARPAVSLLQKLLKDEDAEVRGFAEEAIQNIERKTSPPRS